METLELAMDNKAPYAVLLVRLPAEFFSDSDHLCLTAGTHIAQELGSHLEKHGHTIPVWVRGGCEEDWGVYLESEEADSRYQYAVGFFPDSNDSRTMAVHYERKVGFWRRLLRGCPPLEIHDPIHDAMRSFGTRYEFSELLTEEQFESG